MTFQHEPMSPMKAIRLKCLDCCCGSSNEVSQCPAEECPLHPFRAGKNPYRTPKTLTAEQRLAASLRLQKAREQRLSATQEA